MDITVAGVLIDDVLVFLRLIIRFSNNTPNMRPILSTMTERILVDFIAPISERTVA
jgi:hypothetical protein